MNLNVDLKKIDEIKNKIEEDKLLLRKTEGFVSVINRKSEDITTSEEYKDDEVIKWYSDKLRKAYDQNIILREEKIKIAESQLKLLEGYREAYEKYEKR